MVDDDIMAIFATVSHDIEPDLAVVIAEATRRGRVRRARRRLTIACTASASVVAIAAAATVAAHLASARVHGAPPAGPGGHRHVHVLKPKAHHTRPAVPQAHGPGMRPSQMLAVLRTLLPPGTITYVAPYPFTARGDLELNFDDGKGAADIQLSVSQTQTEQSLGASGALSGAVLQQSVRLAELYCNPLAKPQSCTRSELPNGDVVMRLVTAKDYAGQYGYSVHVNRPDGVSVTIEVANGTLMGTPHLGQQGYPSVDRPKPPGSLAIWEKVVMSPRWHL